MSMTTPRVTVPVERAEYERLISVTEDLIREVSDPGTEALAAVYCARRILDQSAMLSAAPAPEGGAGKGPGDYTMSLTEPQAFERFPALASHIERMAVGRSVGSLIEWDAFLRELNAALAAREEAPAEAGEIGAEYDDAAHCVTLAECPPGLFLFNGALGFKSEYGAMELDDSTNGKFWRVGNRVDAYCADSGEYFWGGTSNHNDRAKLLVYPIGADVVAMVASHGPSALRAKPQARSGEGQ